MTQDERARRAANAEALLKHALLVEAFETIEGECIAAMVDSNPADSAGRDLAHAQLHALRRVRARLQSIAFDGVVAKAEQRRRPV